MKTEDKIIAAAKQVFVRDGFDGARMQKIADLAETNKALLYYYYKTKQNLFQAVFLAGIIDVFPVIISIINNDMPLFNKLDFFIDTYLTQILKHPEIPSFIVRELALNPEGITKQLQPLFSPTTIFIDQVNLAVKNRIIIPITAEHLLVNMVSMCVFPIIGKPMVMMITRMDKKSYKQFLEERKEVVKTALLRSIKLNN